MYGPVMLDLVGLELTQEECELLTHPAVGGVILFARNYLNRYQLKQLIAAIRAIRPNVLVAVDQEGGRVQRFDEGFVTIPPMRALGDYYDQTPAKAEKLARDVGWLMATELRDVGVDFSFAPVLDLDTGNSQVIGTRAFHRNPATITTLAGAFIEGLKEAGCASVGKHFPGHGFVQADSHTEIPVDTRSLPQLEHDLSPFAALIKQGLDGIMPAHVIYTEVDRQPAGFSRYWLQQKLRTEYNFKGVIFSDDLSMEGASVAGDMAARVDLAQQAGCDMLLICNDRTMVSEVLDHMSVSASLESQTRLAKMAAPPAQQSQLRRQMMSERFSQTVQQITWLRQKYNKLHYD